MMDTADKLWDLANFVTGFSIAHTLATIFMLAKDEIKLLHDDTGYRVMRWATFGYTLFYLAGIFLCGSIGANLDSSDATIWWWVTAARAVAVIFFTAALYFTIYGHRHYKAEREQARLLLNQQKDFA